MGRRRGLRRYAENPIEFEGAPSLGPGEPALLGYSFTSTQAVRDVIVNLSGQALSVQLAGGGFGTYTQVTSDPTADVQSASQLTRTYGTVGSEIALAPYSITLASRGRSRRSRSSRRPAGPTAFDGVLSATPGRKGGV